jgi:hypothetical protein
MRIRISLMKKNDDQQTINEKALPPGIGMNGGTLMYLLASDSDLDVNASFVLSSRPYSY